MTRLSLTERAAIYYECNLVVFVKVHGLGHCVVYNKLKCRDDFRFGGCVLKFVIKTLDESIGPEKHGI